MQFFIRLFKSFILFPVYGISHFFPRTHRILIFGSGDGLRVSDNSYHLFLYALTQNDGIKKYFVTNNKEEINRNKVKNIISSRSLRAYFLCLRAKCFIISHSIYDVPYHLTGSASIVQLWHGIPLKKIGDDTNYGTERRVIAWVRFIKNVTYRLLPYCRYNRCDYLIIPDSNRLEQVFASAFRSSNPEIIRIGLPRMDVLNVRQPKDDCIIKNICWLPTHRMAGGASVWSFTDTLDSVEFEHFHQYLQQKNIILWIKPHPLEMKSMDPENLKYSHVKFFSPVDPSALLNLCDILLTDYSSVFFDFLKTDKPIIFTPFDLSFYMTSVSDFYWRYDDITPGPKCKTWTEVMAEVDSLISDTDMFRSQRAELRKSVFGNNLDSISEKAYEILVKLD